MEALAGSGAKLYRDEINKAFVDWIGNTSDYLPHIKNVGDYHVLIELFETSVESKTLLHDSRTNIGVTRFLFPIAKIINSAFKELPTGSIVGINPTLTMIFLHPKWQVYEMKKMQEPQPVPPLDVPMNVWAIDIDEEGWTRRRFIDGLKPTFEKRYYLVTKDEIKVVYDLSKIESLNLNSYIDAKI